MRKKIKTVVSEEERALFKEAVENLVLTFDYVAKFRQADLIYQPKPKALKKDKANIAASIDLHGLKVDAAIDKVIHFLAQCITRQHFRVRIIHGKGSGVLRKEILHFLSRYELVKSMHTAHPFEGGGGAVIVQLSTKQRR